MFSSYENYRYQAERNLFSFVNRFEYQDVLIFQIERFGKSALAQITVVHERNETL